MLLIDNGGKARRPDDKRLRSPEVLRSARIGIKVTEAENLQIHAAAQQHSLTVSEFIRTAIAAIDSIGNKGNKGKQ